jgi:hypothetical protein
MACAGIRRSFILALLVGIQGIWATPDGWANERVSRFTRITQGAQGTLELECQYARLDPVSVAEAEDPRCGSNPGILDQVRGRLEHRPPVCLEERGHPGYLRVRPLQTFRVRLTPMTATTPLTPSWLTPRRLNVLCPEHRAQPGLQSGTSLADAEIQVLNNTSLSSSPAGMISLVGGSSACSGNSSALRRVASEQSQPSIQQACSAFLSREANWAMHRCLIELNGVMKNGAGQLGGSGLNQRPSYASPYSCLALSRPPFSNQLPQLIQSMATCQSFQSRDSAFSAIFDHLSNRSWTEVPATSPGGPVRQVGVGPGMRPVQVVGFAAYDRENTCEGGSRSCFGERGEEQIRALFGSASGPVQATLESVARGCEAAVNRHALEQAPELLSSWRVGGLLQEVTTAARNAGQPPCRSCAPGSSPGSESERGGLAASVSSVPAVSVPVSPHSSEADGGRRTRPREVRDDPRCSKDWGAALGLLQQSTASGAVESQIQVVCRQIKPWRRTYYDWAPSCPGPARPTSLLPFSRVCGVGFPQSQICQARQVACLCAQRQRSSVEEFGGRLARGESCREYLEAVSIAQ